MYIGNCVEFEADFVQNVTGYDALCNNSENFHHPETYKVSKEDFRLATKVEFNFDFYGKNDDIYFGYVDESDIHFFFTEE